MGRDEAKVDREEVGKERSGEVSDVDGGEGVEEQSCVDIEGGRR